MRGMLLCNDFPLAPYLVVVFMLGCSTKEHKQLIEIEVVEPNIWLPVPEA